MPQSLISKLAPLAYEAEDCNMLNCYTPIHMVHLYRS